MSGGDNTEGGLLSQQDRELISRAKHQLGSFIEICNDLADRGIRVRYDTANVEDSKRASPVPRKKLTGFVVSKEYKVV